MPVLGAHVVVVDVVTTVEDVVGRHARRHRERAGERVDVARAGVPELFPLRESIVDRHVDTAATSRSRGSAVDDVKEFGDVAALAELLFHVCAFAGLRRGEACGAQMVHSGPRSGTPSSKLAAHHQGRRRMAQRVEAERRWTMAEVDRSRLPYLAPS